MNFIIFSLKFIFIDVLGDFIYWPIWWYTVGLIDRLKFSWQQIKKIWISLGLGIWLKNIFVPMYGDRSIIGRLISFFIRIIILIWRMIWFLVWVILILITVIVWIVAPIIFIWMIFTHFRVLTF